MINFLVGVLVVLSIIIVISILMQPSKQNSAASAFTGGADQLFGKQKARGFEAVMQRTTAVLTGVWLLIAFVVVFLSSN
ncbi:MULTISPECIES: preprotein translocase subunit SecG [unclassified Enterococcus]|uniref:preprotein translocase subunit SecG n=1 Tax=unclassified Enterococcus TaxID=2608891 RepID=UPI00155355AD|nr:preprotein translocase subunit SecG [Enterococcus sp. MMGLQ5-2]MBS7584725.1 preprotein translocase subunit SecG [Enterococcus sp. MMGLQ5-1]NPD12580.1 preprotein translocase subunit SecG [Enterococcus sp. MMGLQ5-1]NPD37016.1 preprotein translocase subunit SecG [Enterococcus sp. MMGLQ5-2]